MEKLRAFCCCDCDVLGNTVHSERPFRLVLWSQWLVQLPDVAIDKSTLRTEVTGTVAVLIIGF